MQFDRSLWWAILPIYINVGAALNDGDFFWVPVWAILGFASTYCFWLAEGLFRRGDYVWGPLAVLCASIVLVTNLTNAIGSTAEHRMRKATPREDKIRIELALKAEDAELADKIGRLGWTTRGDDPIVIRRSVEQLRADPLYRRSGECRDITKTDSGSYCANLRGEEARLDAAVKAETLERRRAEIRQGLVKNDAPVVADAQVSTLKKLLSRVVVFDEALLAAGLNGLLSVVIEIIGSLVPAISARHQLDTKNEGGNMIGPIAIGLPQPDCPVAFSFQESSKPSMSLIPGHSSTQSDNPIAQSDWVFISSRLQPDGDGKMLTRPTYSAYAKWCRRESVKAVSEAQFAEAMDRAGYTKRLVDKRQHYVGVALKEMKLEVVG